DLVADLGQPQRDPRLRVLPPRRSIDGLPRQQPIERRALPREALAVIRQAPLLAPPPLLEIILQEQAGAVGVGGGIRRPTAQELLERGRPALRPPRALLLEQFPLPGPRHREAWQRRPPGVEGLEARLVESESHGPPRVGRPTGVATRAAPGAAIV